jgi:putative CocE/NonD family hydrolase
MKKNSKIMFLILFASLLLFSMAFVLPKEGKTEGEKISKPGVCKSYSQPVYKEWARTSKYIPVRDGTLLAVDIFHPSQDGEIVSEPLPLIWTHHRYHRGRLTEEGKLLTILDQNRWLRTILTHGYIVASVDVRGGGASYGTRSGPFTPEEAQDAYDITEWFASQSWCDGNIGMFGGSYLGIAQYFAAGTAPPHLKAIMPSMSMFDLYSFVYPGGVFQDDFILAWSQFVNQLDNEWPPPPVDEDTQLNMRAEARKEHRANKYPTDFAPMSPYRDSIPKSIQIMPYLLWSPHNSLKGIKEAGSRVAVYQVAGWYDLWGRDMLVWFNNLENPQKIIITPWCHSHGSPGWEETVGPLIGFDLEFDLGAEQLRWYDYWLKGIDNGIMDEPPIYYFTMGAPEDEAWRTASRWPLPEAKSTSFYFHAGPSGSIHSTNDGLLNTEPPASQSGQVEYTVDYTTTTGQSTRWYNGIGVDFHYPDMSANDEKALTYTTPILEEDIEVTGHPVATLWVSSTAEDGDFFVYLEEVDENGYSHYITEGVLRASHRKISSPPFEYMRLPYHRSFEEDIALLPEEKPAQLVFDLHPTSNVFNAGHRIRVTVACADQNNYQTPELSPSPRITVFHSSDHPSSILLPVIPSGIEVTRMTTLFIIVIVIVILIFAVIFLYMYLRSRLKTE